MGCGVARDTRRGNVTDPRNATTTEQGRFYTWPPTNETFTSVTTILNVLSKPNLISWAAKQASIYAMANAQRLWNQNRVEAIKECKEAHTRISSASSAIGTTVHHWVECHVRGKQWDPYEQDEPEHARFFKAWELVYKPRYILSEATVYNRAKGYAGTLDLVAEIDGKNILMDVKTGNNIYPEVALQLCAYKNGEFIGVGTTEHRLPRIDGAAVLHLRPDGYRYIPTACGEEIWKAFQYVIEAYRWQAVTSKNVFQKEDLENWDSSLKNSSAYAQHVNSSTT